MVPKHIAFIMDGNGRWAKSQGKPRTFGHKKGGEVLKQVCRDAYNLGVEYVTVYAFSTENWKRSTEEVTFLMGLLRSYLKESIKNATENNMRVRVIGSRDDLAKDIRMAIDKLEVTTKDFTGLNLTIALNYGGRDELLRSMKKMFTCWIKESQNEGKQITKYIEDLTEEAFNEYLDTAELPDPDLLIRTSGELRTSNYLPWQLAYTEFYFPSVLWPDFTKADLEKAIAYYEKRDRRFGGVTGEN